MAGLLLFESSDVLVIITSSAEQNTLLEIVSFVSQDYLLDIFRHNLFHLAVNKTEHGFNYKLYFYVWCGCARMYLIALSLLDRDD